MTLAFGAATGLASILPTHPDLIDLDLHAARWYPDA